LGEHVSPVCALDRASNFSARAAVGT
jgi:hypothetical protein